MVQPIAVKQDGTRVPAVERQCEQYLQAPTAPPKFLPEQRLELFTRAGSPRCSGAEAVRVRRMGWQLSAELIYVEIIERTA